MVWVPAMHSVQRFRQPEISLSMPSGLTQSLTTQMVQRVEPCRPHKQLLEKARQPFEITRVRSQLPVEYYLVGIREPMDLGAVIQAGKRALVMMEISLSLQCGDLPHVNQRRAIPTVQFFQ